MAPDHGDEVLAVVVVGGLQSNVNDKYEKAATIRANIVATTLVHARQRDIAVHAQLHSVSQFQRQSD